MTAFFLIDTKKSIRGCGVDGCQSVHYAKDFCRTHYRRFNTSGRTDLKTPEERFWDKVKMGNPDECWEWQGGFGGPTMNQGVARFKNRIFRAHRVAWMLTHKQEPLLSILHSCDNPPCCNPHHLREGTQADNMADMVSRNRQQRGSRHALAKLTESDVSAVRALLARGLTPAEIAAQYGVGPTAIRNIAVGKTWRHVV